ncbi:hypothetical protein VNI00_006216 [Paramarasmius palmivorus]|uniref:RING-type domain-containing protein n=1 Tax=Paramarasmius palmivorus TaxID=297713 RepID=A0AAW0D5N1_9AGAR
MEEDRECYCAICDEYFWCLEERASHIQSSRRHPKCEVCNKRFLNHHILRMHYIRAPHHFYCVTCERHFETLAGFQVHCDRAPIHNDNYDEGESYEGEGKEDEIGLELYPDGLLETRELGRGLQAYETLDAYDLEPAEDLGDPPFEPSEDEEEEFDDSEETTEEFECPMCEEGDKPVCSTACGHLFCVSCIKSALHYTGQCPICNEPGEVEQLRRIFVSCT